LQLNSLKAQRGATLIHGKHIREPTLNLKKLVIQTLLRGE